jgi:hypothetical protein
MWQVFALVSCGCGRRSPAADDGVNHIKRFLDASVRDSFGSLVGAHRTAIHISAPLQQRRASNAACVGITFVDLNKIMCPCAAGCSGIPVLASL